MENSVNGSSLSLCVLASGSKGNCTYVSNGSTSVLLDAGLSGKEIQKRLDMRDIDPASINAVIVSHEHGDHIKGAGVLSRRFNIPVYFSRDTYQAGEHRVGKIKDLKFFECGREFHIGEMKVHPFSLSHDAADTAAFTFESGGVRASCVTDLGIGTSLVKQRLKGSDLIVLESNYDPVMLETGPYPWDLKQRIKSRKGHLSNHDTRDIIEEIQDERLAHVILAHLSEDNNTPEKALESAQSVLAGHISLEVASQDTPGKIYTLGTT